MSEKRWSIGVDLGGTKIEVANVSDEGLISDRLRVHTDVESGPDGIVAQITDAVQNVRAKHNGSSPTAIGVGIAGQVRAGNGLVTFAPNLNWKDVPLGARLSESLDTPVVVDNDVRVATLGEWLYGAGKGCQDFICMFVGTGIGGGVVSGNRLLSGCTNTAGEIGHITVDMGGPVCHCGNSGCLEAVASGWAIARDAREAANTDPTSADGLIQRVDGNLDNLSARTITAAALEGDRVALKILDRVVDALVAGSIGLVNGLNPCRLILGGGVTEGFPQIIERVNEGVRKYALAAAVSSLEVIPTRLHNDSGVIGAAALALNRTVRKDD